MHQLWSAGVLDVLSQFGLKRERKPSLILTWFCLLFSVTWRDCCWLIFATVNNAAWKVRKLLMVHLKSGKNSQWLGSRTHSVLDHLYFVSISKGAEFQEGWSTYSVKTSPFEAILSRSRKPWLILKVLVRKGQVYCFWLLQSWKSH